MADSALMANRLLPECGKVWEKMTLRKDTGNMENIRCNTWERQESLRARLNGDDWETVMPNLT